MHPSFRFRAGFRSFALLIASSALLAQAAVAAADAPSRPLTGVTIDHCSWDRPGHNPYRGDPAAAIDRYTDIDADTRARLKARIAKRAYDDVATISRDGIVGKARYGRTISDMYFGQNTICKSVSRAGWTESMRERGLVYCEGPQCILVPTVCRNVSRIARAGVSPEMATGREPALPGISDAAVVAAAEPDAPKTFAAATGIPGASDGGGLGWPGGSGEPDGTPGSPPAFPGGGGSPGGPIVGGGGGGGVLPPVTPAPEPETWALMLGGLVAVVATATRRRRQRRG